MTKKIKDIFHYEREEMSRVVRWVFGLPFAYTLYLVITLLIPSFGNSANMLVLRSILYYGILIFCLVFVIKNFIKFDLRLFVTDNLYFNFRKLLVGFSVMFILSVNVSFIQMAINPSDFYFSLSGPFVLNWFLNLILVILAAFAEELIYRSYVGHFLSDKLEANKKKQLVYCFVSAFVFMLSHLSNPEIKVGMVISCIYYFIMGFSLMAFVFATGGIEFSIGVHIANNLVVSWLFTYPDSVLTSNALFTQSSAISFISLIKLVLCLSACAIVCRRTGSFRDNI